MKIRMRIKTFTGLLALVMVVMAAANLSAGELDSWIYWTDSNNGGNAIAKVQRANLDGTNRELLVTPPGLSPRYISLDIVAGKMYWTDIGRIRRANLDGTSQEVVVAGLPAPKGIALDAARGHVYWTDTMEGKIRRANLDGTGVLDILTNLEGPRSLALDLSSGRMYWTETQSRKVRRANIDGTGVQDLVTVGLTFPQGITVSPSESKIYWLSGGQIMRSNMDGSGISTVITGLRGPIGMALDVVGGKIYWTDIDPGIIQRANLNGTAVEDLVTTNLDTPWGIALKLPPHAVTVTIDIKPASFPNSINLSAAGVIPVAILSADTFDATTVDPESVSLAGASVKLVGKSGKYLCHEEDVNGDDLADLVCQVYPAQFMIEPGESLAVLEAETFDGQKIRGEDSVRIVPDQ